MEPVKTSRREKAAATRRRMLAAATEVFVAEGYGGARMPAIAERAGVAVQTLYFTFHTKGRLLEACIEAAVLGPDELPPEQQPFWDELRKARSGPAALAAFVRGNAAICARTAAIKEVAEQAVHEPEPEHAVRTGERLRREGYAAVVAQIDERFGLRAGLSRERATDLLLLHGSGSTYLTLHRYGWSHDEIVDWLAEALSRQLLGRR